MPFSATAPTEFLSVAEMTALIATAQDVPVETVTVDGEEVTRYGKTPASEVAMERLVTAFLPLIRKEARRSKVNDEDDAEGILLGEFIATVHLHDVSSPVPFSSTIGTILRRKMSDTDRTSDLISVTETSAAVYWRLMHKHDHDFASAYAEVKSTANGIAAITFLSVHNIIGGIDSFSVTVGDDTDTGVSRFEAALGATDFEDRLLTEAEVEWLFSLVTSEEEAVCRLAYGFRDDATEILRVAAGFKGGEILSDVEISGTSLPLGRATVQRRRVAALAKMRAAMEANLAEVA